VLVTKRTYGAATLVLVLRMQVNQGLALAWNPMAFLAFPCSWCKTEGVLIVNVVLLVVVVVVLAVVHLENIG